MKKIEYIPVERQILHYPDQESQAAITKGSQVKASSGQVVYNTGSQIASNVYAGQQVAGGNTYYTGKTVGSGGYTESYVTNGNTYFTGGQEGQTYLVGGASSGVGGQTLVGGQQVHYVSSVPQGAYIAGGSQAGKTSSYQYTTGAPGGYTYTTGTTGGPNTYSYTNGGQTFTTYPANTVYETKASNNNEIYKTQYAE